MGRAGTAGAGLTIRSVLDEQLRAHAVTDAAWDRERAGYVVRP
jgi:hypothetical protein